MAAITAELVKDLREKTGAGMMDCKKALAEAEGDLEKAVEVLRKAGMASAGKKAGRLASEGLIDIHIAGPVAAIVEVNSETDFVAKTLDFQNFVKQVAEHVTQAKPASVEALLQQVPAGAAANFETLTRELVAKIGENLSIRRFTLLEAKAGERFGAYLHMGNKIGALVQVKGDAAKLSPELLKDLAMHVAAASPRFLKREQIPEDVKAKEREIYLAQLQDSGKPKEMLEKIVEGKIGKFAAEVCFVEQGFIKDPTGKKSVQKHLQESDSSAQIVEFVRFQVGEGMAKKTEDFAAEVAKQLK
ncbi:MAG TPA: elongation factor Ts [Deltaproteobacteria bacterium]|nr:elongation factor Ts [Deltaproteobacteria bacterium]